MLNATFEEVVAAVQTWPLGDRLLAHGSDSKQIYAEARTVGVAVPFALFAEDQCKA